MQSVDWKPRNWLSLLLSILVGPFVFLYANSPKLFWGFITVIIAFGIVNYSLGIFSGVLVQLISIVICFVGVCFFVIKNSKPVGVRKWYSKFWWALFIIFIVLIFTIRSFFIEPFRIPAASMSPSLESGDIVITNKFCYGSYGTFGITVNDSTPCEFIKLKRGHIYAFKLPRSQATYLKRLVGLPGDQIEIKDSQLYLNGRSVERQLVSSNDGGEIYEELLGEISYQIKKRKSFSRRKDFSVTVPQGQYFLLGDNRDRSADSRSFGSLSKDSFVGRVVYSF